MSPALTHFLLIMFIGAAISFPLCLLGAAVAWRSLDQLDGRG